MSERVATDQQILEAITMFINENGFSPSTRDVMLRVGIMSTSTMNRRLVNLRKKGLVSYIDYVARTLRVL